MILRRILLIIGFFNNLTFCNAQDINYRHKINGGLGRSYRLYNNSNDYLIESRKSDFLLQYQYRISKEHNFFAGLSLSTSNPVVFDSVLVLNRVNSGDMNLSKLTAGFLSYSLFGLSGSYVHNFNHWVFTNTLAFGPVLTVKDDVEIIFPTKRIVGIGGYNWGKGIRNQIGLEYIFSFNRELSLGLSINYTVMYGYSNLKLENQIIENGISTIQKMELQYKIFHHGIMINLVCFIP